MRNIHPESAQRKREKENRMNRAIATITRTLATMGLLALAALLPPVQSAETIVIGKGSGVVWEGMPFSHTLEGPMTSPHHNNVSLFAVSIEPTLCRTSSQMTYINGIYVIQIAPGVGFTPRLSVDGFFTRYDGTRANFAGTVGLPTTDVRMDNGQNMRKGTGWCFSPLGQITYVSNYYSMTGPRQVNFNGNWAIITDGTQTSQDNIPIPVHYFATYSQSGEGNYLAQALPTVLNLRISTLECIVDTPTQIDFGAVPYVIQAGTELAMKSNPFLTQCSQDAGASINANINVQLRSLSGHHDSNSRYLALNEGGGYITGEINNGVTGSGACNLSTGALFDGTPMPIGAVATAQTGANFINEVTWRLCSGGNDLPTGPVTASAELLVTFN
ncbi:hypothetical protein [Serratia fonticola]|uniref:hypothetical protein n=1 Tax=Serratia fonticola TaxID=47917 RepID=UPI001378806C|nr:hypothetical protein [Serratia fonticola]NCG54506.1 hypothetical protein [Serratia fonticola]